MTGDYEQITVEREGPLALITLNRPERMNAWTWTMSAELGHAFGELDDDDSCRAIVVTGAGRAFCAGADLRGGRGTFSGDSQAIGSRDDAENALRSRPAPALSTPIIGAINGAAVGAGLTMPVGWDLRVAAEDAKLGFVFNRRGIMPDADLLWLVPRLIGASAAMDLLLTGRIFTGQEAFDLGLVHRVTAREDVLDVAMGLARDIAGNTAPVSAAITKRVLWEFLSEPDRRSAARRQSRLFGWTGRQDDAAEGVMAFVEKRDPAWKLSKSQDYPEDL
jgi:enoyl-CoA hydratase/carnithine racemase